MFGNQDNIRSTAVRMIDIECAKENCIPVFTLAARPFPLKGTRVIQAAGIDKRTLMECLLKICEKLQMELGEATGIEVVTMEGSSGLFKQ